MIYIMILIGVILIIFNIKSIKEEESTFNNILKNEEKKESRDYDIEIISIRRDLAESLLDIQKELEILKEEIYKIKEKDSDFDNKKEDSKEYEKEYLKEDTEDIDVISEINFNNKIEINDNIDLKNNKILKVKSLLEDNISEDQICNELNIGKGEVLLIKSLLKK